jgi:hypothetical protein
MADAQPLSPPAFTPERAPMPAAACNQCGFSPVDLEPHCPTCGSQRMPPNVVLASRATEQDALIARVEDSLVGRPPDSVANVLSFGGAVRGSVAVVNVSVRRAIDFVESNTLLYATYAGLMEAGARLPAPDVDDARRRSVEAILFGSYGEAMRYAALSLTGAGLDSYGPIAMVLRDQAIAQRASLLEENSFDFVERHKLRPGTAIPAGFRSPWVTRHQLAMAKCASEIDATTSEIEHPSLLCRSSRDRRTDKFIEVFIFGPFGRGAIERLVLPARPPAGVTSKELRMLRSKAGRRGIVVEES